MDDEIKKPSFLVYYDNEVIVLRLPDDEAGKLFKSLFPYGKERIKPNFDSNPALAMAFDILSMAIDRDREKYLSRCEANRENGRKGGLAKARNNKQSLPNGKQGLANLADKDKDIDKDMDKDKDSINTISPEPEMLHCNDSVINCNTHVTDNVTDNVSLGKDRLGKDKLDKDKEDREYINYQQIADLYNDTCVSFPRLTKLSDSRKKAIKARMKTYSLEDFKKLFQMAEESSFLKGENARNWSATFDWLIKDSNMAKVLDGNYQNRQQVETEEQAYEMPDFYKNLYAKHYKNYVPGPDDPFQ